MHFNIKIFTYILCFNTANLFVYHFKFIENVNINTNVETFL